MISVDVDSFDSLVRFYNLDKKEINNYDPVYQKAIPRYLELFDEFGIKATFFIVAEDCKNAQNVNIIKKLKEKGHEIANHSLNHKFAFSLLSGNEKTQDIQRSTEAIEASCGVRPVGFRVPGYDVDGETVDILEENGYLYDSSVYKFSIYPILRRLSYLKIGHIQKREAFKKMPAELACATFSPMQKYYPEKKRIWKKGEKREIVEIPLSVTPYLSIPFNSTFLFLFGNKLFDLGLWFTKKANMNLNYNFHSTDMLSSVDDKLYIKHPGSNLKIDRKISIFRQILNKIKENYNLITLEAFARER